MIGHLIGHRQLNSKCYSVCHKAGHAPIGPSRKLEIQYSTFQTLHSRTHRFRAQTRIYRCESLCFQWLELTNEFFWSLEVGTQGAGSLVTPRRISMMDPVPLSNSKTTHFTQAQPMNVSKGIRLGLDLSRSELSSPLEGIMVSTGKISLDPH